MGSMKMTRRSLLAAAWGCAAGKSRAAAPLFSFGVVADVQYADKPPAGKREYSRSLRKLEACCAAFGRERLRFVIQLGDLVDGGLENLVRVLAVFNRLKTRRYHVVGNHDADIPRDSLLARLGLRRAWYDFSIARWRFVVLDGTDAGVFPGWDSHSSHAEEGRRMLGELRRRKEPHAQDWNGGLGADQMAWLRQVLARAHSRGQRAILFCHQPVLPESCRPDHLLWNYREVLDCIDRSPAVVAYFNGHDHRGGYAQRGGVHFLTVPGLVENDPEDCAMIADVYPDAIRLRGFTGAGARHLLFP